MVLFKYTIDLLHALEALGRRVMAANGRGKNQLLSSNCNIFNQTAGERCNMHILSSVHKKKKTQRRNVNKPTSFTQGKGSHLVINTHQHNSSPSRMPYIPKHGGNCISLFSSMWRHTITFSKHL